MRTAGSWSGPVRRGPRRRLPSAPTETAAPTPLTYTPPYLAEKIFMSRSALEGERKQVTVLFADLKGSMELLAERDPGGGPPAPRSGPGTHDGGRASLRGDRQPGHGRRHYGPVWRARWPMRTTPCGPATPPWPCRRPCSAIARRCAAPRGWRCRSASVSTRGEVVVRAIGNDLHMDYSAIGQTTHLAARMEQLATPGQHSA